MMYWLRCEMQAGMLANEHAIVFTTADGKEVSLFAEDDKIKTSGGSNFILVELVDQNASHGLVRLPSTPLEGSAVVKVCRDLLSA